MKSKIKKITFGLLLAFGASTSANAVTVFDPTNNGLLMAQAGILQAIVGSTGTSATATTATSAQLKSLSAYLMGVNASGGGIIANLQSMNVKLGNIISDMSENHKNGILIKDKMDSLNRRKGQILKTLPNTTACENMSTASGRGGASSKSQDMANGMKDETGEYIDSEKPNINNLEEKIATKETYKVCTEEDVKSQRAGCKEVGEYSAADKRASSLLTPPIKDSDNKAGIVPNETYEAEQLSIALKTLLNLVITVPEAEVNDPNQTNTNSGMLYTVNRDAFLTRLDTAVNGITNILSSKAAGNLVIGGGKATEVELDKMAAIAQKTWVSNENKSKWEQLNPNKKFPTYPSERERLKFEIDKRYADTTEDSWQQQVNNFTEDELSREIAQMQAIELKLNDVLMKRMDDNNLILAALLANSLDPVSRSNLKALKSGIQRAVPESNK